jgi:MGT family glycosyltransferase
VDDSPSRKTLEPENDLLRDWEATNPVELIGRLRDKLMFGPAELYARDVTAELERSHYDCVVSNDLMFGPPIAAEAAGVPCVFLSANIYFFPRAGVPPFGPGFAPASNPDEERLHAEIASMSYAAFGEGTSSFNNARRAFGLDSLSHPFDQLKRLAGILCLTSEEFDFPSTEKIDTLVYAGPELGDPVWAESWVSPWAETDPRPLVLVSLSSTFQDQKELLLRLTRAVTGQNMRVVLTTGPAISEGQIPSSENVHVCRTAPHSEVLKHASAMVTHCGHGSVARALAADVPLVCIPMGRDQDDNAARVVHRGAGIRLSVSCFEGEILDALNRLLTSPSYKACASKLGAVLRRDYERSTAVHHLEKWARGERVSSKSGAHAPQLAAL